LNETCYSGDQDKSAAHAALARMWRPHVVENPPAWSPSALPWAGLIAAGPAH
jgi:hypothetical protein